MASFRLHGYIREILPVPWVLHAKRNWKQSLAMVMYDLRFGIFVECNTEPILYNDYSILAQTIH